MARTSLSRRPVANSHTRTTMSAPPDASSRPSGDMHRHVGSSAWASGTLCTGAASRRSCGKEKGAPPSVLGEGERRRV